MTIRRRGCCNATGAKRWKKCFWMWRADASARPRDERRRGDVFAAPRRRDGAALLVSVALVLRAADRADLLADRADADVGLSADLPRRADQPLCARRRRVDRRRDAVGRPVPRAARLLDLVPRRNVVAQPRQPDDLAAAPGRVRRRPDGHEHYPPRDRHGAGDGAGDLVLRLQSLGARDRAGGLLRQPDVHRLGGRDLRLRAGVAERARRRDVCLEHHVPVPAPYLRLLPRYCPASMAPGRRLVAPANLRVRGDAGPAHRAYIPRRPYDSSTCAERRLVRAGGFRLPWPPRLRPP